MAHPDPERFSDIVEEFPAFHSRPTPDGAEFRIQFQHCRYPVLADLGIHDRVDQRGRDSDRNEERMQRSLDILGQKSVSARPNSREETAYPSTGETTLDSLAATLELSDVARDGREVRLECCEEGRQVVEERSAGLLERSGLRAKARGSRLTSTCSLSSTKSVARSKSARRRMSEYSSRGRKTDSSDRRSSPAPAGGSARRGRGSGSPC